MKRYVKQKVKHKVKLYLTRVSVRQMRKQHSETKRSVKRRKKENRNTTTCTNARRTNEAQNMQTMCPKTPNMSNDVFWAVG